MVPNMKVDVKKNYIFFTFSFFFFSKPYPPPPLKSQHSFKAARPIEAMIGVCGNFIKYFFTSEVMSGLPYFGGVKL